MKFGIEDNQLVINHLMLEQSPEIVTKIADTNKGKGDLDGQDFELKVLINGVEIEVVESFENFMKHQYDCLVSRLEEEYNVEQFDARVKEAAEKLIKDKFEDLLDKMYEFENCLDFGIDDMYK